MKPEHTAELRHHQSDFSVLAPIASIKAAYPNIVASRIGQNLSRVSSTTRDSDMARLRTDGFVLHHVYVDQESREEVLINDEIVFWSSPATPDNPILRQYNLRFILANGNWITARVTDETGMNPIKLSRELAAQGVNTDFERVPILRLHGARIWHISPGRGEPDTRLKDAHDLTHGDPDIVIAVIDDGFDLGHPCFENTRISPALYNFVDDNAHPFPQRAQSTIHAPIPANFHGTPVASLIFGQIQDLTFGAAPGCTFLPIRIGFGVNRTTYAQLEKVFSHVSQHADIVCCSFGTDPSTIPYAGMAEQFREFISDLTRTGGRRGKGLTVVCSAGNSDAPIKLESHRNTNGVSFMGDGLVERIDPGLPIWGSFPLINGVLTVGAVASVNARAAYSNFGINMVVAPSNNGHELCNDVRDFNHPFPGEGIFAAQNRRIVGGPAGLPVPPGFFTNPGINPKHYTARFGGTSAAAAIVAGISGLVKSTAPDISNELLVQILKSSTSYQLEPQMHFNDPNLQGTTGSFTNGQSEWYGLGLIDAKNAVTKAQPIQRI